MQEVRIMPIGDIQLGAPGCDVERLRKHLRWGMDNDCYFLGIGDYTDRLRPSTRRILRAEASDRDDFQKMIDEKAETDLRMLLRILKPTRGRWLGLVSGHHLWEFGDGSTTDTRLANELETHYMGDAAAMSILRFKHKKANCVGYLRIDGKIWYHHGHGNARTLGGKLSKLIGISQTFFAHVYLQGHVHAKVHAKTPWIDTAVDRHGKVRWVSTSRIVATTGGFLKGYAMGTKNAHGYPAGSYVEKAMLPPVALGGILIMMRPRIIDGRVELDIGYQDG